jgi:hypothetical protein
MKASKFLRLKERFNKVSSIAVEAAKEVAEIVEKATVEVVEQITDAVTVEVKQEEASNTVEEPVAEVKTLRKKAKNE